jgi:hypothetical protein
LKRQEKTSPLKKADRSDYQWLMNSGEDVRRVA